jgi:hypothetical protein
MKHARAVIFFAGTAARDRFKVCLLNTASKDELLSVMENHKNLEMYCMWSFDFEIISRMTMVERRST